MVRACAFALVWFALPVSANMQPPPDHTLIPPNLSANDLVRTIVDHEMEADDQDHSHWMYKDVTRIPPPEKEKTVVETRDGDLTRLDEIDNQPLTPAQRSAEVERIRNFVADVSAQHKAQRASSADDQKSTQLFSILPDAFLFTVAERNGDTMKLSFHPNPSFHARSMAEFVFHKMDGFVVVNTREKRLVEIAGTLTHGVEFAGGLLGHLDPGGTFDVRLQEVAPGVWKMARMKVNMHGRVLFFKTVGDQEDETRSDFKPVPDSTTMAQAEQMLLNRQNEQPAGQ
jgi:hypothetical protein